MIYLPSPLHIHYLKELSTVNKTMYMKYLGQAWHKGGSQ